MNFITVITIVFVLQYLRTNQRALNEECDGKLISPSDYTIWVQGIPEYKNDTDKRPIDERIQEEMQNQINENYKEKYPKQMDDFIIENVTVCYNLESINKLNTEKDQIIVKMSEHLKKGGNKSD